MSRRSGQKNVIDTGIVPVVTRQIATTDITSDLTNEQLAAVWDEEKPPVAGPLANLAAAIVVVLLGIGALVLALSMGMGTPANPEPGMWPAILSVVLIIFGLVLGLVGRQGHSAEKFTSSSLQVVAGCLTLFGFVAAISAIGFEIPALLLTFVWLRFLGKETWKSSTILSIVIVLAFYLIFVLALGVPIPHLF